MGTATGIIGGAVKFVFCAGAAVGGVVGFQLGGALHDSGVPSPGDKPASVAAPGCVRGQAFVWKDAKGHDVWVMRADERNRGVVLGPAVGAKPVLDLGTAFAAARQGDKFEGDTVLIPAPNAKACNS